MTDENTRNALKNLTIRGCMSITDEQSGAEVYHVNTPHALAQASGYLKYKFGKSNLAILFRGQTRNYDSLSPTLFRGIIGEKSQSDRVATLKTSCKEIAKRNKIFDDIPVEAHEPLLQHYGLKTSWIDLVDNVWIALWFACHRAHSVGEFCPASAPMGPNWRFE
ncbi:MAG: FRG domain-containing protein [Roseomonas sp.]|nr:FRG domain-containing protein [Roseomonas sp.]MCA3431782.1 FRG domain-containing protein [Roseomonas sp.]MCA3434011.1 FRG domain-containing protein [Roseomonas sp.]